MPYSCQDILESSGQALNIRPLCGTIYHVAGHGLFSSNYSAIWHHITSLTLGMAFTSSSKSSSLKLCLIIISGRFISQVSCSLSGRSDLLERWRRPNKFGNLVSKKNLMFFSTVIASKSEIARNAPIFWLYHFIFLDEFHHISTIT